MPLSFKIENDPTKGIKGLKTFSEHFKALEYSANTNSKSSGTPSIESTKNCKPELQARPLDTLSTSLNQGKNVWVLKPTHLNRGRGISLFNSLEKLVDKINNPEIDFLTAKTATRVSSIVPTHSIFRQNNSSHQGKGSH